MRRLNRTHVISAQAICVHCSTGKTRAGGSSAKTRAERRQPGSLREAEHLCLFSPFDGSTPLFFHPRTQPAGRPIPSALQLLVATVTSPPALALVRWRCARVVCFYLPSGVLQQRLRKWVLQSTGALVKAAKNQKREGRVFGT